jgi:microcystin-dependent protein
MVFTASRLPAATVTTLAATGFSAGSATLNAAATLSGGTSYFGHFEYGLTTNYGSQSGDQILGNGSGNVNFNQPVTWLASNQIYHFRADLVLLSGGTIKGNDLAFTIPGPPLSTTAAATLIHPGQATLNGTINPNNTNNVLTSYWFQYGTNTSYGSLTPTGSVPSGTSLVAVSILVTGLPRGVTNHFCLVASNVFGQSFGADLSFNVPQGLTNTSGSTGAGQAFDGRQPSLELNFIICTNGIYPSRDSSGVAVPFLGEIRLFAGNFAPAKWTFCQGQLLSISNYSALFSVMGVDFGGDGRTNFNLPDLRGFRPVDSGDGPGLSPWVVGEVSYNANFAVSPAQETLLAQNLPAHTHSLPAPYGATGSSGSPGIGQQPRCNWQPSLGLTYALVNTGSFPTQGSATIFEPFLGQVILYADTFDVDDMIVLNGQVLTIDENGPLFNVIGTTYGGDGTANFLAPNLQSRVPMGIGQGPTSLWALGQQTGVENVFLTQAQMPAHQHTVPSLGTVTGFTGSNQSQTLLQPSMALQFLICTNGQIPSPSIPATNQMLGEIQMYAGTNLPGGWLPCDGRLMQVAGSPSLFGVISNWYGGDGVTTFALPDLRGRVPVGSTNGQPGAAYGAEQTVLTVANLPPHTHPVPALDFDFWITSFGLSGNPAGFSADSDGDAAENGYEWATGTNPTNAQSRAPVTISSAGGKANIHFLRNTNAIDVVFTLLRSTNLANSGAWSAIATNTAGVWTSAATVTESGSTNPVNVTIPDALTNAASANYRLQITWP